MGIVEKSTNGGVVIAIQGLSEKLLIDETVNQSEFYRYVFRHGVVGIQACFYYTTFHDHQIQVVPRRTSALKGSITLIGFTIGLGGWGRNKIDSFGQTPLLFFVE